MGTEQRRLERRPVEDADAELIERIFGSSRELERDAGQWTTSDWESFVRVQCNAQRTHYETFFPESEHEIVLADELPIGRIWIDRRQDELRLLDITLLPEYRGQGIGTSLIQALQCEAQGRGTELRHMVERDNERAFQFYARLGFKGVSEHGMHILMEWRGRDPN